MTARLTIPSTILVTLALQATFAAPAHAQSAALYYDAQTERSRTGSGGEGMAWGYLHTGPLPAALTLTADDPVTIQLYDNDQGERYVGGSNDELQLWMSDTNLSALAGESVRFEFFSVVPANLLDEADEAFEGSLDLRAQFLQAPGSFATVWNTTTWPSSSRDDGNRASSFEGYPAADHVVRLYYVHLGRGFSGLSPSGRTIPTVADAGNKKIWASASVSDTLVESSTNQSIWENAISGRGMEGVIVVENTSDREALTVNLDFLHLMEDDSPNIGGNDDDLLATTTGTSPSDYQLAPGATLKWKIFLLPKWEAISEARDFLSGDGDLEPYANFSVSGDPEVPLEILSEEEVAAMGEDQPETTVSFGAAELPSPLPPPPVVAFSGAAETYTIDQDVDIACTVTDGGGGIVYDTCADVYGPAWSYPAGISTYDAYATDLYGQEGTDSVSFEVVVTPDALIAITERFVDHAGIENSLVKKIEQARKAKTDTAQDAACEAFIHEVEAQAGKHVTEFDAEVLIYWAEELELQ